MSCGSHSRLQNGAPWTGQAVVTALESSAHGLEDPKADSRRFIKTDAA